MKKIAYANSGFLHERKENDTSLRSVVGIAKIMGVFILHFAVLLIGFAFPIQDAQSHLRLTGTWFDHFMQWDAQWYAAIAKYGYQLPLDVQQAFTVTGNAVPFSPALRTTAYFPGFPLIIHLFGSTGSIIVGSLVFIATLVLMYLLVERRFGDTAALFAIILYAINPAAIYESALYVEVYSVLCTLLIVYGLTKASRTGDVIACIAGFMGTSLHELGLISIVFGLRFFQRRQYKFGIIYGLSVVAPWFLFVAYLWGRYQQPFAIFHAETAWQRVWRFPGTGLVQSLPHMSLNTLYVCGFVLLIILYVYASLKWNFTEGRLHEAGVASWDTSLWVIALALTSLSTYIPGAPLTSVLRFLSVIWPIYALIWTRKWSDDMKLMIATGLCVLFGVFDLEGSLLFSHGLFFQ